MPTISETAASLRIFGDDLDPDEITAKLGKQPDTSAKKGESVIMPSGRKRIARTGRWSVSAEKRQPGDLDAQIRELLAGTTADLEIWRSITSRFDADIFCGLFMEDCNEGLALYPDILAALGKRGICLSLDIYERADDEDA